MAVVNGYHSNPGPEIIQERVRRGITIPPGLKILGRQTPRKKSTAGLSTTLKPGREVKCKPGSKPISEDCPPPPEFLRILGKDRQIARPISTAAEAFFWKRVVRINNRRTFKSSTQSASDKQSIQKLSRRFWKFDLSKIRN